METAHVAAINAMLSTVVSDGTGRAANIDRPQAGKTGTSQNFRDAWFVGYTANLVGGIWMGNDNGKPMNKVTGGGMPAKLWREIMVVAHKGSTKRALPGQKLVPWNQRNYDPGFWKGLVEFFSGGGVDEEILPDGG